ncbi:MAG TPA: hypothetical protein VKA12_13165 [Roseiarcus sp.]|nr:hypothetical protein [Roseiarcus sp.]
MELSFRLLYWVPQIANSVIFLFLVFGALLALIGGLMGGVVPQLQLPGAETSIGHALIGIYRLGWVLVLAGALAGVVVTLDVFARIELFATSVISGLPIRGLEGRFGTDGRSAGWVQAREFVRNGSNAWPLYLDNNGIDRVVASVHERMITEGAMGTDRASTPHGFPSIRGNIALFGCILEQAETDLKAPYRKWDLYYGAFDDVSQASNLFDPAVLLDNSNGNIFWQRLRAELNSALLARAEPSLTSAPVAQEDVAKAFDLLKQRFHCDVTKLASRFPPFASPAWGAYRRAEQFPRLSGDVMRPQFVKLLLRWEAIPFIGGESFTPAFSKTIAWYLLDNGAFKPLSDAKELVFQGPVNRKIARMAVAEVSSRVAAALAHLDPNAAPNLLPGLQTCTPERRRWMIEQEVDTTLWRQARASFQAAKAASWKDSWRWKLDDDVARRL